MRHIERLPEPAILKEKHDEWQEKFDKAKKKEFQSKTRLIEIWQS